MLRMLVTVAVWFAVSPITLAADEPELPRMHFADTVSGRPFSKDPAVVKFKGRYLLYYSLSPYETKPTRGWSIGVATSDNLVDWRKVGQLPNTGEAERNDFSGGSTVPRQDGTRRGEAKRNEARRGRAERGDARRVGPTLRGEAGRND